MLKHRSNSMGKQFVVAVVLDAVYLISDKRGNRSTNETYQGRNTRWLESNQTY
jgi:hypothetical protein